MEVILVEKEGVVPKPSSTAADQKAPKKKESKKKIARKNAQTRE
jgi:hypothetical protein